LYYSVLQHDFRSVSIFSTLTIRLDDKLERELTRLAKQTGHSKSGLPARYRAGNWPSGGFAPCTVRPCCLRPPLATSPSRMFFTT